MTTHEYDLVVAGAGIAGLSAAVAASENGARVAVLERAPEEETGGNTRYTEAFMQMQSLDEVAEGLEERLLGDFMGHPDPGVFADVMRPAERRPGILRAHHVVDPDYVEALVANAGTTLHWLTAHGVRFEHLPTPFLTASTTRMSPVGGGLALVEALGAAARELRVDFHFQTTARALLTDGRTVTGVSAMTSAGPATFHGATVLACGGFEGNAEMLARYQGSSALPTRPVARGGYYNKGEGIEMALAIGAATAGNFASFHAEPVDPRSGAAEAAIFCFPYGILVNQDGRRFVDEARGPVDAWYERTTRDIQAQTQGVAYCILDAEAMAVPGIHVGIRTDQPPITASTITELAGKLQIPAGALTATVEEYNAACGDGHFDPTAPDGLATAGLSPAKSNWARPLAAGSLHAYPIIASNVFTFGGLKTDTRGRVLDRDGTPIDRLYAAGEITGLYYTNYAGSTSVMRGAVFGKIAGEDSAAVMLRKVPTAV